MNTEVSIQALIPAAGQSIRFGGTTLKQYAYLAGRPVIAHSIDAVLAHANVSGVTVALAPDDGIFEELIRPLFPQVVTVPGGDSRAHSVANGLRSIAERHADCGWVLVHDAARPCLSRPSLNRLIREGLEADDGALLAHPVTDTLKLSDEDGTVRRTVDRERLWAAQTPQLFPISRLLSNLEKLLERGEIPTDEAGAMEAFGAQPRLVRGLSTNLKITGSEDLALAEFILQRQWLSD